MVDGTEISQKYSEFSISELGECGEGDFGYVVKKGPRLSPASSSSSTRSGDGSRSHTSAIKKTPIPISVHTLMGRLIRMTISISTARGVTLQTKKPWRTGD